jgi:subtilisin family serine protease
MSMLRRPRFRASLLAAAIIATPFIAEARRLDTQLEAMMLTVPATEAIEVIVTFHGDSAPTDEQRQRLAGLGLTGVTLNSLPIAGVLATPAQINALLAMDDVRSVWLNQPLDLENREATALTGVDRLRTDSSLRVGGFPVTGRGLSVVVNDSGIDGTHPDLKFPEHTRQNVLAQTNLYAFDSMLPITYQEGVANTDIGGGHGSHVAGIIGGNGAASPGGSMEGVAPGAGLIGYGSGAGLFILDTIGGFDYALTHQAQYNIRVISNSFGATSDTGTPFDPDHPTNVATKRLADRGVVVVFSAGNSGSGEGTITGNFKKAPWVVTVAAGDKKGRLATFSSRGEKGRGGSVVVDGVTYTWEDRPTVTAPGVDIASARASLGALDKAAIDADNQKLGPAMAPYYTHMSGTSMSAPHVSGIVALMLEANPGMDWRDVKRVLQETASNIPGHAS